MEDLISKYEIPLIDGIVLCVHVEAGIASVMLGGSHAGRLLVQPRAANAIDLMSSTVERQRQRHK